MMETCPYSPQISAYHDGELADEARCQLEQHLTSACPACVLELQQWRKLSSMLISMAAPALPDRARQKLYRLAPVVREASFIRLAEWTTALAASVLIAVSAWMMISRQSSSAHSTEPARWTTVAFGDSLATTTDASNDSPADPQFVDYVVTSYAAGGNKGHE
jgi:anti-sigma factor RsiW